MTIPTKDVTLLDAPVDTATLPQVSPEQSLIERLARDQSVDVDKLERLITMQERAQSRTAQEQFNAAMSAAQSEMRPVGADAENPQTRSRYASYEALDRALRPIYTKHGFGLSFNTGDAPLPEFVRVLCDVSHIGGFSKTYKLDMPADGKGAKGGDVMTKTHATGSALSYGMRYLLKMIFNVAVGEDDDDGNRAGRVAPQGESQIIPAGYDDWLLNMTACADEGWPKLSQAFGKSKDEYRKYATGPDKKRWAQLKDKAEKVTKATRE